MYTRTRFARHVLHQERVARRLTIAEAATLCGIAEERWWQIEYGCGKPPSRIKGFLGSEREVSGLIKRLRDEMPIGFARHLPVS